MAWKYYREEEKRHSYLNGIYPSEAQVVRAVRRFADLTLSSGRRRENRPFRVVFRAEGAGWSWCTKDEIVLTHPVSWLLVIHEFAHLIQWRWGYRCRVWHGPAHRRLVDELAREIIRMRWDLRPGRGPAIP